MASECEWSQVIAWRDLINIVPCMMIMSQIHELLAEFISSKGMQNSMAIGQQQQWCATCLKYLCIHLYLCVSHQPLKLIETSRSWLALNRESRERLRKSCPLCIFVVFNTLSGPLENSFLLVAGEPKHEQKWEPIKLAIICCLPFLTLLLLLLLLSSKTKLLN